MSQRSARLRTVLDHERVHHADEPRLAAVSPAFSIPTENADVTLNKQTVTMNRGGSDTLNPILRGLGHRFVFSTGSTDRIEGVFIYQNRRAIGPNLLASVGSMAPGVFNIDTVAGAGLSKSGPSLGVAVRNFIRWQTSFGTVEKQFFVKDKDPDVILIEGKRVLDDNFQPTNLTIKQVDLSFAFITVAIDFFPSWNDAFHVQHNAKNPLLDPGFLKAYGGTKIVSFFDTGSGEGVGVQVNPITQKVIDQVHEMQIENTLGVKNITVRFRSKGDSPHVIDCPITITVVADPQVAACDVPEKEPCTDILLKVGTPLPAGLQDAASVPLVQDVVGTEGVPLTRDLLYVAFRSAIVGTGARIKVQRWAPIEAAEAIAGARVTQISENIYLPLRAVAGTPVFPPPYNDPEILTVAFDVLGDTAANVAYYTLEALDGDLVSTPVMVLGPNARKLGFFPPGGLGGGVSCYYEE